MIRYGALRATAVATTGRRTFAAAADAASHQPKVKLHGLAARYANSTYVAASKVGQLDAVDAELAALKKTASESADFSAFLNNPLIPRSEKAASVKKLTEGKFSPISTNLLTVLAGNARLGELIKIADVFEKLMAAEKGLVNAVLITAEPLDKKEAKRIAGLVIKAHSGAGAKVVLKTQVDPSIIGGFQVQIGDEFLDLSVKSRVDEISRTPV